MATENRQVVERFIAASSNNDLETMAELMHPEAVVIEAESLPYGGIHKGVEGFQNLVRRVFSTFSLVEVKVGNVVSGNDYVIAMATLSGKTRKKGLSFEMPVLESWRVVDGQIVEVRPFYFDTERLNFLAAS